jgi:hypothetical protein
MEMGQELRLKQLPLACLFATVPLSLDSTSLTRKDECISNNRRASAKVMQATTHNDEQ